MKKIAKYNLFFSYRSHPKLYSFVIECYVCYQIKVVLGERVKSCKYMAAKNEADCIIGFNTMFTNRHVAWELHTAQLIRRLLKLIQGRSKIELCKLRGRFLFRPQLQ